MAASALATRNYTDHYVTPVIEKTIEHTTTFLPQAIPFFASTTTFDQIRQTYPDYTYKEAALNPTNLRDRATDWEADMINYFRNSPKETELVRLRDAATGPSLSLAHPIRVEAGCLQCHSQPGVAPKALIKHYGSQNGFGWNLDEVIGAQIISVPTAVPIKMARQGLTAATHQPVGDISGGYSPDRYWTVFHRHPAAGQDLPLRGSHQSR